MLQHFIDSKLLPPGSLDDRDNNGRYFLPSECFEDYPLPTFTSRKGLSLSFDVTQPCEGNAGYVTALLTIGRRASKVQLQSSNHDNYIDAITEVGDLFRQLPVDPIPATGQEVFTLFKQNLSQEKSNLHFTVPYFANQIPVGIPIYIASTVCQGNTYASTPYSRKIDALLDLIAIVNDDDGLQENPKVSTSPANKKLAEHENKTGDKEKIQASKPKKKQPSKVNIVAPVGPSKKELELLQVSIKKWRREHNWLVSRQNNKVGDETRVHDLSRFLTIADPLRWHELSTEARNESLKKMEQELLRNAKMQSDQGKLKQLATYIRSMVTAKSMSPGDIVDVGEKWIDRVCRNGDEPTEILQQIVALKLLRPGMKNGEYSLSNRGITLVEKFLKADFPDGTLGSQVSADKLFALLQR